jgi:hypothetical protein
MDGRSIAHTSPHFPVPVLRGPCRVSIERQYYDLQVGVIMGRRLHGPLWMHHIDANFPSRQPISHPTLLAGVAHR